LGVLHNLSMNSAEGRFIGGDACRAAVEVGVGLVARGEFSGDFDGCVGGVGCEEDLSKVVEVRFKVYFHSEDFLCAQMFEGPAVKTISFGM
jgi:hypothetical protein